MLTLKADTLTATAAKYLVAAPCGGWLLLRNLSGLSAPKRVWLTFDDGPHPHHTLQILQVLARHEIRATFFLIGSRAQSCPDLVKAAFNEGHRIGNHSFSHIDLRTLDGHGVAAEIAKAENAIGLYLGTDKLFRPPMGARNQVVDAAVKQLGYRTVLWNVSTRDWSEKYQPDQWMRFGTRLVALGGDSRVLMHDDRQGTADNLDVWLDRVKRLGQVTFMPPETL